MKYKMFVTDFDNTLLRTDRTVSDVTVNTIKEFERRGGKFVLATGRMLSTIIKTIEPYGFHGELIAFQGGEVVDIDTGEVLYKRYVDPTDAQKLLGLIRKRGYYAQIYANGKYYVNRYAARTRVYEGFNSLKAEIAGEDMWGFCEKNGLSLDKIVFGLDDDGSGDTYEKVISVIEEMSEIFGGRMVFNSSNILLIEAVNTGCTKGEAVEFVARRNGIKREEVICMGDALNDASMVKWAGLGVAVSNATDDLKQMADLVTVSCDEDAVGKIIREYCLEEK